MIPGRRPRDIQEVAERHLCSGCGACAYLQPDRIRMVDTLGQGRRPLVLLEVNGRRADTRESLSACPGATIAHGGPLPPDHLHDLGASWGPAVAMWEGWASDPEIRRKGSSGGVATALGLFAVEGAGMHGVLHTVPRRDIPYLNQTVLSSSRVELLAGSGSRYAPASPCERLDLIESAPGACVMVGKPCDVAAASSAAEQRPALHQNLGLTIAVFCAGTPTTEGTLAAIRAVGMDPEDVESVRYRGEGWPGRFTVRATNGTERSLSYEESWGEILQKHRQWRCMICPDHTGEFADLAVGDPWYRPVLPDEAGQSLIVARTQRGLRFVQAAIVAGFLTAEPTSPDILPRSQPNLLAIRGAVWGRTATMSALGLPAPAHVNLPTLPTWWSHLTVAQKLRSTLGTARRVLRRRLYRRQPIVPEPRWNAGNRPSGAERC